MPKQVSFNWWKEEHKIWLAENRAQYIGGDEITTALNAHFGTNYTVSAVLGACKRFKIKTGRTGWDVNNLPPPRKGRRFSIPTEFKKGTRPNNAKPVGAERIDIDGYRNKKIAEPNTWRHVHLLLWEETNGPVPKGSCVLIIDGDKQNITIENLCLVTRSELCRLNQMGFNDLPKELRPSMIALVKMECARFRREKLREIRGSTDSPRTAIKIRNN